MACRTALDATDVRSSTRLSGHLDRRSARKRQFAREHAFQKEVKSMLPRVEGDGIMSERKRLRETDQVVRRVMKIVEKSDHIGKAEFEKMLRKIAQEVHKNTGMEPAQIAEATQTAINDLPHEYGQLTDEQRSWEALIGYLYLKHLKVLGVLE
jgi:hypothetical protein